MSVVKSISGIRGTIGGRAGDGLNPLDIVKFTSAYASLLERGRDQNQRKLIVVGRDARISGEMVFQVVSGTLMGMGWDVMDIGLSSTPTTELAVTYHKAAGGIILTASHNPREWNALKLLNSQGEFLTDLEGKRLLEIAGKEDFEFAPVDGLGHLLRDSGMDARHVEAVLALELVDVEAIRKAHFRVALDTVNSVGGLILPRLLEKLGVAYDLLFGEPTGDFQHNPEPLEKNLGQIMEKVRGGGYDLAFVVDPDVDRLAMISEDGRMYGEEYTLVTAADYVLSRTPGCTVSNLSSTRALRDVTASYGQAYYASAVGEVNVTTLMKAKGAVIGGEGNGGVIYPALHYGRDALVGIALILSHLAHKNVPLSRLRRSYPEYFMAKNRIDLKPGTDVDRILARVKEMFLSERVNDIDGVKIDFEDSWVHLRKSNTEPIIRVYSEAHSPEQAEAIARKVMDAVADMT